MNEIGSMNKFRESCTEPQQDHVGIGVKPSKISGDQAKFMEKYLKRKREVNPPISNRIIQPPKLEEIKEEQNETKITKPLEST